MTILRSVLLPLGTILTLAVSHSAGAADTLAVRYPNVRGKGEASSFHIRALDFILKKSGVSYTITMDRPENQVTIPRAFVELERGGGSVNLICTGPDLAAMKKLTLVPFPVYRGLIGYRLMIINSTEQERINKVDTFEQMRNLQLGQGIGWVDAKVLKESGLKVEESVFESLFKKVQAKRIDGVPLGMTEVFDFMDARKDNPDIKGLTVDKHILIKYKWDLFFYVNKNNTALQNAITKGFENAYADGSYLKFFTEDKEIHKSFDLTAIKNRKIFEIPNTHLNDVINNIPAKFWHNL